METTRSIQLTVALSAGIGIGLIVGMLLKRRTTISSNIPSLVVEEVSAKHRGKG